MSAVCLVKVIGCKEGMDEVGKVVEVGGNGRHEKGGRLDAVECWWNADERC